MTTNLATAIKQNDIKLQAIPVKWRDADIPAILSYNRDVLVATSDSLAISSVHPVLANRLLVNAIAHMIISAGGQAFVSAH